MNWVRTTALVVFAALCFAVGIPAAADIETWPTYQRDANRSGHVTRGLSLPLVRGWEYRPRHAPQPAWPPPAKQNFWIRKFNLPARVTFDRAMHVVADQRVVVFGSSADDQVRCLDLSSGRLKWRFFAEGPVRLAPTIDGDRVFFGSDDGCVYCLDLAAGTARWKRRVAETDRRIPGNRRMISAWPVRTGILVDNGVCRFAAGLFPRQGAWQFGVDAKTGDILARGPVSFSPQGYMQRNGGRLMVAQGRAPRAALAALKVPPPADDPKGSKRSAGSTVQPPAVPKLPITPVAAITAGSQVIVGGHDEVMIFERRDNKVVKLWSTVVRGKAHSLAVSAGRLLASTDQGHVYCFAPQALAPKQPATHDEKTDGLEPSTDAGLGRLAQWLLNQGSDAQGYCLVWGSGDGRLAVEIARRSTLTVIGIEPDGQQVAASRRLIARSGVYGRVAVHHGQLDKLPYAGGLFNLVVSASLAERGSREWQAGAAEVHRVLRPGTGLALLGSDRADLVDPAWLRQWGDAAKRTEFERRIESNGDGTWLRLRRRPLAEAGQWTHMYANPANTACSDDRYLKSKLVLQWFGPPGPQQMIDRHHRTVPPLMAAGRLFIPGDNRVIAVDAYNGTVLWNVEVSNSRRVGAMRDCGSMAATADSIYVVAEDRCYGLASGTGEARLNFAVPNPHPKPRHWGYVARVGKRLFGSTVRPGASRSGHSREQISETYYDFVPIVTSDSLFAMDRRSGKTFWQYRPVAGAIVNSTITIGDGKLLFVESANPATLTVPSGRSKVKDLLHGKPQVVALDATSGKVLWRQTLDLSALEHSVYLAYADGHVILAGSRNHRETSPRPRTTVWYDVHALDATSGKPKWSVTQNQQKGVGGSHGEQDLHPVIVGNQVIAEPYAYDLKTGKQLAKWNLQRRGHGCGALSASAGNLFFRAFNPTQFDLTTRTRIPVNSVSRPGCWINMIPAGGLLLIPEASSGCTCNFPIQSSLAYTSEIK